jgi:hypothetical protein
MNIPPIVAALGTGAAVWILLAVVWVAFFQPRAGESPGVVGVAMWIVTGIAVVLTYRSKRSQRP